MIRVTIILIFILAFLPVGCAGQNTALVTEKQPWSRQIADSYILRHPGAVTYDSASPSQKWNYEQGLMLVAFYQMWLHTKDEKYLSFIKENIDQYIEENGNIKTYRLTEYNCDNIAPGRVLLALYSQTKQQKYRAAADSLRKQLNEQPRTNEGGFWHKKIYPYQMWLDGLFMVEPFYAQYANMFNEPAALDDVANQFIWIANHTRDVNIGLYYHGWDESGNERWANPQTGCSPNFWGRSIGWFAMGLVDALDDLPEEHPKRKELVAILVNLLESVVKYRDRKSSLWYQVVDRGNDTGNYLESSASCMVVYALAKSVNQGYGKKSFFTVANESFTGIIREFVTRDAVGRVDLHGTCAATGLGGNPYRDGSYNYYTSVQKVTNDKRGIGAFLLAAIEIEKGAMKFNEGTR